MPKYLIDASVIHGLANTKDRHHSVCKEFFEENANEQFHFSVHSFFEVHAARLRRIRGRDFVGLPGQFKLRNQILHILDNNFYKECKRRDLFSVFDGLKGSDLIYACLAKIRGLTLVTCDEDFNPYADEIGVLRLTE